MLKLPKGLKKKKKKSKKDQELFTEEELEEYKRQLKAKQEAAAAKSDAGESDAASDVEGLASTAATSDTASTSELASAKAASANEQTTATNVNSNNAANGNGSEKSAEDDEWAKFKALTSGVDTILHKTQDELDRIKKESFYQRLPSAAEKKKQEEEEAARREAERLEEEKRKAAELEAQRDKLAEAVVQLSESEVEDEAEVDDIFVTEYVDAITSGELQLVVPDSPVLEFDDGPDPFDTAYAEKVIVGADKAKGNKKLVSLGAAVEVLSGRVEREKALELAKPKRKLRKGIKNLLLSESIDQGDLDEEDLLAPEPQKNLLDELVDDVPEPDAPIDLSVSLHLSFIQPKKPASDDEDDQEKENQDESNLPDLSEFDTLKSPEDDEFAELAAESLNKKEEVKIITEIPLPKAEVLTDITDADWAEFEQLPEEEQVEGEEDKTKKPPPRPETGPHLVPGAVYVSDDEVEEDDDPFNTSYAEQVIKKTTVLEEDDDFDPRAEEKSAPPARPPPPTTVKIIAKHLNVDLDSEDFDPFDTTVAGVVVKLSKTTLKHSLSDPDFDPRAEEQRTEPESQATNQPSEKPVATPKIEEDFDTARRKSSLSLSLQNKTVGFLVPNQDLLGASEGGSNKKPLTPYYAPSGSSIAERESEDPFDTSYVPENKPTDVELKHIESDLLSKPTLQHSLSDPDFDPRAPPTPVPAEDLLAVKENINTKVLTPAQESKDLPDYTAEPVVDPFDTSIAADLKPGQAELKLLESELLPEKKSEEPTAVLDIQSDAQELGLGDKVLTPQLPHKRIVVPEEVDPFDTSIAENLKPGETEIKLLENEFIEH